MAIQILQQPGFGERVGTALGQGLGSTLSQTLGMLAQDQARKMMQQRQLTGLQALGFSPQQAQGVAQLDPMLQKEATRLQGIEQRVAGLSRIFPNYSPQELRGLAFLDPRSLAQVVQQQQLQSVEQPAQAEVQNILGQPQITRESQLVSPMAQQILQDIGKFSQEQSRQLPQDSNISQVSPIASPSSLDKLSPSQEQSLNSPIPSVDLSQLPPGAKAARELRLLERRLSQGDLTPAQATKIRDSIEKREESYLKKQEKIDEKTNPFVNEINTTARGTQEGFNRLNRMETLIRRGDLIPAQVASFLDTLSHAIPIPGTGKSIGLNLKPFFYSPDSQEFEKLSKDFLKNAKNFFGSRITQQEVQMFLDTVPTLMQTSEGQMAVIRNMKLFGEANLAKQRAMEEVIEDHGGFRPRNLEQLTEKKAKPLLDSIAQDFSRGSRLSQRYQAITSGRRLPSAQEIEEFKY